MADSRKPLRERGDRVIKTYVWHGEQCYFVSTANRNSSAAFASDSRYAETMVWEVDFATGERGNRIVAQASDCVDGIDAHIRVVKALHATGEYEDD